MAMSRRTSYGTMSPAPRQMNPESLADEMPEWACPKMKARHQYRVVWKRKGLSEKKKRYERLAFAQRFVTLLGPEPWKALGRDPDERFCCSGRECGCGGVTVREHFLQHRESYPALEYVRIDQREIRLGAWAAEAK